MAARLSVLNQNPFDITKSLCGVSTLRNRVVIIYLVDGFGMINVHDYVLITLTDGNQKESSMCP